MFLCHFSTGTKPKLMLLYDDTEVFISCSLSPAVTASECNLYFGESTQSHQTINKPRTRTKTNELLCQFNVSVDDFWTSLHKVQRKELSCDYTLGGGHSSPRSDGRDSQSKSGTQICRCLKVTFIFIHCTYIFALLQTSFINTFKSKHM